VKRLPALDRAALLSAVRLTIVAMAVFVLGEVVIDNPNVGLFGFFGSFALLLLVFGLVIDASIEYMLLSGTGTRTAISFGTIPPSVEASDWCWLKSCRMRSRSARREFEPRRQGASRCCRARDG